MYTGILAICFSVPCFRGRRSTFLVFSYRNRLSNNRHFCQIIENSMQYNRFLSNIETFDTISNTNRNTGTHCYDGARYAHFSQFPTSAIDLPKIPKTSGKGKCFGRRWSPHEFSISKSKWTHMEIGRCVGNPWKRARTVLFMRKSDFWVGPLRDLKAEWYVLSGRSWET